MLDWRSDDGNEADRIAAAQPREPWQNSSTHTLSSPGVSRESFSRRPVPYVAVCTEIDRRPPPSRNGLDRQLLHSCNTQIATKTSTSTRYLSSFGGLRTQTYARMACSDFLHCWQWSEQPSVRSKATQRTSQIMYGCFICCTLARSCMKHGRESLTHHGAPSGETMHAIDTSTDLLLILRPNCAIQALQ